MMMAQDEKQRRRDLFTRWAGYRELLRLSDHVKNLFIFAPIFFGLKMGDMTLLARTVEAFLAFSLVASAIYIFNDYHDIEEDRLHPEKKKRPLASGFIPKRNAAGLSLLLFGMGLLFSWYCGPGMFFLAGLYVVLNIIYTLWLKHIAIVDVFCIALGFVIRIFVGSQVTGITLYPWLIIVTFLLALFLALAKRRSDIVLYDSGGEKTRKVVDGYTVAMLDNAMIIIVSVLMVFYIMYTVSPDVIVRLHSDKLYITAFFVLLGIMRYMQIIYVEKRSGSPTGIFWEDRFIQYSMLGWVATFTGLIYT